MAALVENVATGDTVWFHTRITRVEKAGDDGSVLVHGKCTGDDLDLDDQIIDKDFARGALQKWFDSYANVRQMHSTMLPPGGKGVKLEEREDGFYLTAKVVEPVAVKLVNEGVYSAYSIGISRPVIMADAVAKGGRVTGGIVSEVSLVDFPANPTTKFVLADEKNDVQKIYKMADAPEEGSTETDETTKVESPDEVKFCGIDECEVCANLPVEKKKMDADERHSLDDSDFAFPKQRKEPINDESHVRNAISRFSQVEGVSDEERKEAAKRILSRAKKYGIKVSDDSDVAQAAKVEEPEVTKDEVPDAAKAEEPEVTTAEVPVEPAPESTEKAAGGNEHLAAAIRLMESGHSDEALTKLREAVDADLALEAVTPAITAPVTAPADPTGLITDGVGVRAEEARKAAEPDLTKDDAESADEDDDEDDDSDDSEKVARVAKALGEYGIGTQHRIRQLHDALCPAYAWEAVVAAHPVLKNGVAAALGPTASALLYQMLSHEVSEDRGGTEAEDISQIACAYKDLCDFLAGESAEEATPILLQSVRDDLHKAFEDDYPQVRVSPLTLDAGDAGRWNRGYVRDGRTPMTGTTTHARLPEGSDGDTPTASDFTRGPLTAGRERPAPEKGLHTDLAKRVYYTNRSKEEARQAMSAVHDHLASVFPDICGTGAHPDFAPRPMSPEMTFAQSASAPLGLNPTDANLTPETLPTDGHLSQSTPHADELGDPRENCHGIESHPEHVEGDVLPAPRDKVAAPDVTKAADVAAIVSAEVGKFSTEITKLVSVIESLSKRVEELEKAPDPAQAPWRGAVGALNKLLGNKPAAEEKASSELDKAMFDARKEQVEYLVRAQGSADPALREMARAELKKLIGA